VREAVFYDKGYGYFRSCIDFRIEQGIEDDQIVELVKFIMAHGIKNSKEITQKMWIEWSKHPRVHGRQRRRHLHTPS